MTLTPEFVYQIIQGVTKVDSNEREHSEALLKKWERDATPGCLDSLMQIATQVANISEVKLSPHIKHPDPFVLGKVGPAHWAHIWHPFPAGSHAASHKPHRMPSNPRG